MELRHLRYFVAVAETLHFGRAAERLHIAQPPLSQQIRRLERELGVQLLDRNSRRVALSEAGRAFLVEARRTLAQAERAAQAARSAHREAGVLTIGYMESAELAIFPRVLPAFRRRHPLVKVALDILPPHEQFTRLRDGRLHIGFVRLPASARGLTITPVHREPFVVVLPAHHPLARRRTIALPALRDERLVVFPRRHAPGYYDRVMDICRGADLKPVLVEESDKLHTMLSLVAMNRGIALLPRCVTAAARRGTVCRPLRPPAPETELGLVYSPARTSPLVADFVRVTRQILMYGARPG